MNVGEKKEKVDSVGFWWHSIDFGHGIESAGEKSIETLLAEFRSLQLPALSGKSVLDIGAWDGYFSFGCEKRGASRVVALDHYAWSMDLPKLMVYLGSCKESGALPEPYDTLPGMWRPDELPGKQGFDAAKEILGSAVEPVVGDFMEMDLEELGQFDIVLFLGVIYHMKNPFAALCRLASVTRELALIETEAVLIPGLEDKTLWEFYESNELYGDVSTWWVPTELGLVAMCRAAGFSDVKVLSPYPKIENSRQGLSVWQSQTLAAGKPMHYRLAVQARK